MAKRTLKELINLLEQKKEHTMISKRGNVYNCKIVEQKIINELQSFKRVIIQNHNVNFKTLYVVTIHYKKNNYNFYLLKQN